MSSPKLIFAVFLNIAQIIAPSPICSLAFFPLSHPSLASLVRTETDLAVVVDVGMEHFGHKPHRRRLQEKEGGRGVGGMG